MSLAAVKASAWMQGEIATKEEVTQHYYSLMPGKKCLDKEHYDKMQEARKAWAKVNRIQRGHDDPSLGYSDKELKDWLKDANLLNLELKEFHGCPSPTGFYSKTAASHLFVALYEHFALQEDVDVNAILDMDASKGKVKFTPRLFTFAAPIAPKNLKQKDCFSDGKYCFISPRGNLK